MSRIKDYLRLPTVDDARRRRGLATQGSMDKSMDYDGARSKSAMATLVSVSDDHYHPIIQTRALSRTTKSPTQKPIVSPSRQFMPTTKPKISKRTSENTIDYYDQYLHIRPRIIQSNKEVTAASTHAEQISESERSVMPEIAAEIASPQTHLGRKISSSQYPQEESAVKLSWPESFKQLELLSDEKVLEAPECNFLLRTMHQISQQTPRTLRGVSSIRSLVLGRLSAIEVAQPPAGPQQICFDFKHSQDVPVQNKVNRGHDTGEHEHKATLPARRHRVGSIDLQTDSTTPDHTLDPRLEGSETDGSEDTSMESLMHGDGMGKRRRLVNQYLQCCNHAKRLPCLKNILHFFLHRPRVDCLEMSGLAIHPADLDAFFSALVGRGCGLEPQKSVGFQEITSNGCQLTLRGIDLSNNAIGAEGMRKLRAVILDQAFFHVEDPNKLEIIDTSVIDALTDLNLSSNAIGVSGARYIKDVLSSDRCTLRRLCIAVNRLQDAGCCSIVAGLITDNQSLTSLDISENNASQLTGAAIGNALRSNTKLVELNLGYNHIRTTAARAVFSGLLRNSTLTSIQLQWNGFGDEDAVATLGRALSSCSLTSLNLAHNRITNKGATILALGIQKATNLTELNLDGNLLGQVGARTILRAAAQAAELAGEFASAAAASISAISNPVYGSGCARGKNFVIGTLTSSAHGNYGELTKAVFDPSETAGEYELDLADAYCRSVLIKLIEAQQNGRGSFEKVRINGVTTSFDASLELKKRSVPWLNVRISDNDSVDQVDWTITVDLGSSGSVSLPLIESISDVDNHVPLTRTWASATHVDEAALSCVVRFSYRDMRSKATMADSLPRSLFAKLQQAFTITEMDGDECIDLINTILSTDVLISVDQMESLLGALSRDEDGDPFSRNDSLSKVRIHFVTRCFHKIAESGRNKEFLGVLTNLERHAAESLLGQVSFDLTPNNPTGFYKLDLADPIQREILFRLIEARNEMEPRLKQIKDFYGTVRAGGKREDEGIDRDLERIWRNSTLDGRNFSTCSKVPDKGIVQVDFVQITRPNPQAMQSLSRKSCMPESQFTMFFRKLKGDGLDDKGIVLHARKHSNSYLFTCQQLGWLLGMVTDPELRVEMCVIGYARTMDWHNYRYITTRLKTAESKILESRIGCVNLFDDLMAVDFYELDLALSAHRFIMQELVHLAAIEPGNNMVDVTLNGVDFSVPKPWLKDVGRSGVVTIYYCREQAVIEKVAEKGAWEGAASPSHVREDGTPYDGSAWSKYLPQWLTKYCKKAEDGSPACVQPAGEAWVLPYKLRRIRMRMTGKFDTAVGMFGELDRDGGGSLDRRELATGLYKLGLWLHPKELVALLGVLDKDGGGTVDFAEFQAFWVAHTFE